MTPVSAPMHAGLGAGRHQAGRRRLGKEVAIGRVAAAVGLALERLQAPSPNRRTGRQRHAPAGVLLRRAGVGHRIARVEIVGPVGDDVVPADQLGGVLGRQPKGVRLDEHMRVDAGDGVLPRCRVLASPTAAVSWITCRCRLDSDTVSSSTMPSVPTPAAARYCEHRRAEPAGADHQHTRALQPLLAGAADLRQHDVARIALQLFR